MIEWLFEEKQKVSTVMVADGFETSEWKVFFTLEQVNEGRDNMRTIDVEKVLLKIDSGNIL